VKNLKLKFIIKYALIITGSVLFINTIILTININFNIGMVFSAVAAVVFILCGMFFEKIYSIKWLRYGVGIAFLLPVCLMVFIAAYGQMDNVTYTEDAVIVLGAGIRGEQVTSMLAYRLDKAVEYYGKNLNVVIVVSGAQGPQEDITEALAMERYLVNKGIPKDKIIKEERSNSTYTNFAYSKELLDEYFNKNYTVALITNGFHIYRAAQIAKKAGLDCTHCHAKIRFGSIPVTYLRECAAVLRLWIMGV